MARPKSALRPPALDAKTNQLIEDLHAAGHHTQAIADEVERRLGIKLHRTNIAKRLKKRQGSDKAARVRAPKSEPATAEQATETPPLAVQRRDWVTIRVSECLAEAWAGVMESRDYHLECARTAETHTRKSECYQIATNEARILAGMYAEVRQVHEAAQAQAVTVVFDFGPN